MKVDYRVLFEKTCSRAYGFVIDFDYESTYFPNGISITTRGLYETFKIEELQICFPVGPEDALTFIRLIKNELKAIPPEKRKKKILLGSCNLIKVDHNLFWGYRIIIRGSSPLHKNQLIISNHEKVQNNNTDNYRNQQNSKGAKPKNGRSSGTAARKKPVKKSKGKKGN